MTEYIKPSEIAKNLKVSAPTVQRWIRAGMLPYIRCGRTIRVPLSGYETFKAKHYCGGLKAS
jgi:excisionase family DNA binding protein